MSRRKKQDAELTKLAAKSKSRFKGGKLITGKPLTYRQEHCSHVTITQDLTLRGKVITVTMCGRCGLSPDDY